MRSTQNGAEHVTWFGDRATLVRLVEPQNRAFVAAALACAIPDAEVRVGMDTVLVELRESRPSLRDATVQALAAIGPAPADGSDDVACITIDVVYSGEDLDAVASALGCGTDEVIRAHGEQEWQVAMMGFAPGFGYLVPLGEATLDWAALDRRDSPRQEVPRGSVAVAAGMSAVYPASMPGGWHVLGATTMEMFDASNEARPTALRPGDRVRFVQVTP